MFELSQVLKLRRHIVNKGLTQSQRLAIATDLANGLTLAEVYKKYPTGRRRISDIHSRFMAQTGGKVSETAAVELMIVKYLNATGSLPTSAWVNEQMGQPTSTSIASNRFSEGKNYLSSYRMLEGRAYDALQQHLSKPRRGISRHWKLTSEEVQEFLQTAKEAATASPITKTITVTVIERKAGIRKATLARAFNQDTGLFSCNGCGMEALWTDRGMPLLQEHHIGGLAKGTPDDLRYTVALCGTCHDKAERWEFRKKFNALLFIKISNL